MERSRRGRLDIYADILNAVAQGSRGSRKTPIVYKANLNFKRCKEYLGELRESGLIKIESHSPLTWVVTERGKQFLETYGEIRDILPR